MSLVTACIGWALVACASIAATASMTFVAAHYDDGFAAVGAVCMGFLSLIAVLNFPTRTTSTRRSEVKK